MFLEHHFQANHCDPIPGRLSLGSKLQDTQPASWLDQSLQKERNRKKGVAYWIGFSVVLLTMGWMQRSLAADTTQVQPSPTNFTVPSLWWVKDQFAAKEPSINKLIQSWSAYAGTAKVPGRVDYTVNRQLWSLLDYLERYTFLNDFGAAARSYGYNIRIVDAQNDPLATYSCDFRTIDLSALYQLRSQPQSSFSISSPASSGSAINQQLETLPCEIVLESSGGKGSLRRSNPSDANSARLLGTD